MAMTLYLQSFQRGEPQTIDSQLLQTLLAPLGSWHSGFTFSEFHFSKDGIAETVLMANPRGGDITCVALLNPNYTDTLRHLIFTLLDKLECFVFDDELGCVFYVHASEDDLPRELREGKSALSQRISSPQQLWPEGLFQPTASAVPAKLSFHHPEYKKTCELLAERIDDKGQFWLDMPLTIAAATLATLHIQTGRMMRAHFAMESLPGHQAVLSLDSARVAQLMTTQSTDFSRTDPDPEREAFTPDTETHRTARRLSHQFRQQVQQKFGIDLPVHPSGLPQLEALLEKIHQLYKQERQARPGEWHSKAAANWARLAGFYFGEICRTDLGAQWGTMKRGGLKWHGLLLHKSQSFCRPLQRVLNRIIEGKDWDLQHAYFSHWQNERAQSTGHADVASRIVDYTDMLQGLSEAGEANLPERHLLPTAAALDFSLASLQQLDRYLKSLAVHDLDALFRNTDLPRCAGAYVGEVIRRQSQHRWGWINYAEYMAHKPADFPDLPEEVPFAAILMRSDGMPVLPINYVLSAIMDADESCHAQVQNALSLPIHRHDPLKPHNEKIILKPQATTAEPTTRKPELALTPDDEDVELNRTFLLAAPCFVFALISLSDGNIDRKEIDAFFKELVGLAKIDNNYGRFLTEALPGIQADRNRYLNFVLGMLDEVEGTAEKANVCLRGIDRAGKQLDRELDDQQARYTRRRLFNLGHTIASASGGGLLRSAISRDEQLRLDALKQCLRC